MIKNAFWGSDSSSDAYRELSCFNLDIPVIAPEFIYDTNLVSFETVLNFCFPTKPDHPDVSGRLDIFAQFGPALNYHKMEICFCQDCRAQVRSVYAEQDRKFVTERDKVISEEFINNNLDLFCEPCRTHVLKSPHIFSGRDFSHLMTIKEIDIMVDNMNTEELYEIIKVEKGGAAKTLVTKIDMKKRA